MPYVCLLQQGIPNIPGFIEKALQNNYSAVATSINANMVPHEPNSNDPSYSDLCLNSDSWNSKIILELSNDIDCDSPNEKFKAYSEAMLKRDKSWSEHLQSAGCAMIRLKKKYNVGLVRVSTHNVKGSLLVRVPISNPAIASFEYESDVSEEAMLEAQQEDTWFWWHNFRCAANYNSKVKVVLEMNSTDRPSKAVVRRWIAEPIEAILVPSTLFLRNRHNYAVLPRDWQTIIGCFITAHVNIIISASPYDNAIRQYADYMQKLVIEYGDDHSMRSYEDALEVPLQPLMDNLDCYTYEVFEKDPVKYKFYQLAIQRALEDRVPVEEADETVTVIMVLGAGRGPLVRAAFNAAELTKRKVRVYIIEKNPNAIRTLSNMVEVMWKHKDVHIFSKDMRKFSPPEQADILVSELLGSFGDNELSPECLDCALKILKPNGISIPCKSISYINPIMAPKLYQSVREFERPKNSSFDFGYVVLFKNVLHIDEPKPLFEFVHPNRAEVINNERHKVLTFQASIDCVLHGIGGYFETVLYKDITLSIHPNTHTQGMFSWFPMYFPMKQCLLKKYDIIEVHFWRRVDTQKVWYEWCLTQPNAMRIHNVNGVGYNLRLA